MHIFIFIKKNILMDSESSNLCCTKVNSTFYSSVQPIFIHDSKFLIHWIKEDGCSPKFYEA